MIAFIQRRIFSASLLLGGMLTLIFFAAHLTPGDPVNVFLSPNVPQNVANELRHQFGLDQNIVLQFGQWVRNALTGNLGISFAYRRPVLEVIAAVLPNTAVLAITAIVFELVLGLFFAAVAVRRHNSIVDTMIRNAALVVSTQPTFWVGLLLLAMFSFAFGLLPSSQMHSLGAESFSFGANLFDVGKHLVLPACTIAIPGSGAICLYFRQSLLKVRREEYMTYAHSVGLSNWALFVYYELPNALPPVISILGLEIGTLLSGAIVTETLFAWPGMGRLTVLALSARDYPLIMGCTLVSGVFVVVANMIADLLYGTVDPRVRMT